MHNLVITVQAVRRQPTAAPAQAVRATTTTARAPGTIVPTMDGPGTTTDPTDQATKAATISSVRGVPAGTDVPNKGGRR